MKNVIKMLLCSVLVLAMVTGCGKKANENKSISEVKAEAEKMSAAQLRSMAESYKNDITAKTGEVEKIAAKLKEIPVTEMSGKEAKSLKDEIDTLNKSVSALKERFTIYYDKLKEKGGDLAGLEI